MRKRILVIDDEPVIVSSLKEVLEGEGYEVIGALDAKPVERLLDDEATLPDLLLLDVRLHDQCGAELAGLLKRRPHTRHLPIILMSAQPQPENVACDVFLPKPFDLRQLLGLITTFVTQSSPLAEHL